MKAKTILVPIDIEDCPQEVFSFVNQLTEEGMVEVTLLHVLRLNVRPLENRVYTEMREETEAALLRLRSRFLNPRLVSHVSVRFGKPAREIVAEAREIQSDLIVLTRSAARRTRRWFETDIFETLMAQAPCPISIHRIERLNLWPYRSQMLTPALGSAGVNAVGRTFQ